MSATDVLTYSSCRHSSQPAECCKPSLRYLCALTHLQLDSDKCLFVWPSKLHKHCTGAVMPAAGNMLTNQTERGSSTRRLHVRIMLLSTQRSPESQNYWQQHQSSSMLLHNMAGHSCWVAMPPQNDYTPADAQPDNAQDQAPCAAALELCINCILFLLFVLFQAPVAEHMKQASTNSK